MQFFSHNKGVWLKGALHIHTTNSDGLLSPEKAVEFYKKHGYGFLSITDHNKITEVKNGLPVIKGIEVNTGKSDLGYEYHVVIIGVEDYPPKEIRNCVQSLIDWARDNGCFVFVAHPYWSMLSMHDLLKLNGYYAIEVFNTLAEVEISRGYSGPHWDFLLQSGRRVDAVAVDDVHYYTIDVLGGWVMVNTRSPDVESILDALKNGKYYSSSGPLVKKLEYGNGELYIETTPIQTVKIYSGGMRGMYFSAPVSPRSKPIISPFAEEIEEEKGKAEYNLYARTRSGMEFEFSVNRERVSLKLKGLSKWLKGFVRIEIIDEDGKSAWLNPLYL